jgi:RHS repeat-associated protein
MTNDGNNTLIYDAESRAVSATNGSSVGAYVYDGNGLRVKKCVPNCTSPTTSTVYVFSGSKVIAEYDNGAAVGSPSREYIYSGGALIAKIDSAGTKYYHKDHLSNRLVTDSSGNTVAQMGHFPYGESWYNASGDKLLFTSYERDSESGNDYALARFNVNRLGRFLSTDPLGGAISNPQSLNLYTYTLNNPLNFIDPTGLHWECITYTFMQVKGDPTCTWVDDGSDGNPGGSSGGAGGGGGNGGGGEDGVGAVGANVQKNPCQVSKIVNFGPAAQLAEEAASNYSFGGIMSVTQVRFAESGDVVGVSGYVPNMTTLPGGASIGPNASVSVNFNPVQGLSMSFGKHGLDLPTDSTVFSANVNSLTYSNGQVTKLDGQATFLGVPIGYYDEFVGYVNLGSDIIKGKINKDQQAMDILKMLMTFFGKCAEKK